MEFNTHIKIFKESIIALINNPIIALPSVTLLLVQIFLFPMFFKINSSITQESAIIHWSYLIAQILISTIIIAFFISIMIFMSKEVLKSKSSFNLRGYKYTFKTLAILILYVILHFLLLLILYLLGIIGQFFGLPVEAYKLIIFIVYMVALLSVFMLLSFPIFISIIDNLSISKSIRTSISFVKQNYLSALVIFILLILIIFILGFLAKFFGINDLSPYITLTEVINFLIIYPLMAIVFTKFYLDNK